MRSGNGYYFAPKHGVFDGSFCEAGGKAFLRRCPTCGAGIPTTAAPALSRSSRSDDEPRLHCAHCGGLLFEAPKCTKCGSLLRKEDAETNTAEDGCLKCRRRSETFEPYDSPVYETTAADDDDIPF